MAKNEDPGAKDKVRVSLDLSEPFYKRLTELEQLTHADSKAGVIRQALQIYEYVARKTLEGHKFLSVDTNGKEGRLVFFSPYMSSRDAEEEPALSGKY